MWINISIWSFSATIYIYCAIYMPYIYLLEIQGLAAGSCWFKTVPAIISVWAENMSVSSSGHAILDVIMAGKVNILRFVNFPEVYHLTIIYLSLYDYLLCRYLKVQVLKRRPYTTELKLKKNVWFVNCVLWHIN